MMLAHLDALQPSSDRRSSVRRRLRLHVGASTASRPDVEVVVRDLSKTGLLVEATTELALGTELQVHLGDQPLAQATVVWRSGSYHGCQFLKPITKGQLSAALLRSPGPLGPPLAEISEEALTVPHAGSADADPGLRPLTKLLILLGLSLIGWLVVGAAIALALKLSGS